MVATHKYMTENKLNSKIPNLDGLSCSQNNIVFAKIYNLGINHNCVRGGFDSRGGRDVRGVQSNI